MVTNGSVMLVCSGLLCSVTLLSVLCQTFFRQINCRESRRAQSEAPGTRSLFFYFTYLQSFLCCTCFMGGENSVFCILCVHRLHHIHMFHTFTYPHGAQKQTPKRVTFVAKWIYLTTVQCVWDGSKTSPSAFFCSTMGGQKNYCNKATGQQTPNGSTHSWEAGVTQQQQRRRGKTCSGGKTK